MNTVYIEQDNLVIHRNSEHLLLTKYGKKINHIPLIEVDTLVLLDSCQITCPALELMFEKNIDIIYMAKIGYSFLANEISLCLAAEKFDLEIGFLHSILYGRNSLTLDIMEEFRTAFIDSWLLKLFNLKMLVKEHFKDREENFYLTKDGFKKFIELYHSHLEEGNWKQVFRNQILIFKNSLLENTEYKPYIWNQSA